MNKPPPLRTRLSLPSRLSALAASCGNAYALSALLQARCRELVRDSRPLVVVPRRVPPLSPIEVALLEYEAGRLSIEKTSPW